MFRGKFVTLQRKTEQVICVVELKELHFLRCVCEVWRCWMSSVVLWFIFPGMVLCRIQFFPQKFITSVFMWHIHVTHLDVSLMSTPLIWHWKKHIGFTGIPPEVLQPAAKPRQRSVSKKDSVHTGHGGEDQRDAELFWSEGDRPAGPSDPRGDAETQVWCSRCRKLQFLC